MRVELINPKRPDGWPATGDPLLIRIGYRAGPYAARRGSRRIDDPLRHLRLALRSHVGRGRRARRAASTGWVELEIASLPLVGGRYGCSASAAGAAAPSAVHLERVAEFHVWPADVYGSGVPVEQPHGLVVPHRRRTARGHRRA